MALERKEIEAKYKWDLSKIYPTEADFDADYARAEEMIRAFAQHEDKMCLSAENLLAALSDMADIEYVIEKLFRKAGDRDVRAGHGELRRGIASPVAVGTRELLSNVLAVQSVVQGHAGDLIGEIIIWVTELVK